MTNPFQQSREYDPGYKSPSANYGPGHAFEAAFKIGWNESLTGQGFRALKYWDIRNRPGKMDLIDKDEFDKKYSLGGTLKFNAHNNGLMSRELAEAMMQDTISDRIDEANAGMSYAPGASLLGSLTAGTLSPVDFALGYAAPTVAAVRWGMGATIASRSGTGAARMVSRTVNGAINGTIGNTLAQVPTAVLYDYNQKPISAGDFLSNIVVGPIMGAAFGAAHGVAAHTLGEWDRSFANAALHAAASDRDPSVAANIAASDPRTAADRSISQRIRDLLRREKPEPTDADDIHHMSGEEPPPPGDLRTKEQVDEYLKARRVPDTLRRKKLIDEAIAIHEGRASPADPDQQRGIGSAVTDDEKFLVDAWKEMFGVELRFLEAGLARTLGSSGFVRGSDPSKAYIRRGALNDGSTNSMVFLAGHELGHSVRYRDPELWSSIVRSVMKTADDDSGALARAWVTNSAAKRGSGVWAGADMWAKMDEAYASVLGQAMLQKTFWQHMDVASPEGANRLLSYITQIKRKLERTMERGATSATKVLHAELAQILTSADADGRRLTDKLSKSDKGSTPLESLYRPYRTQILSFQKRMSDLMNTIGSESDNELAGFVEWNNRMFPQVASFDDDSGTPYRAGRFSTILRNRHIGATNNPALWLMNVVFSKAKKDTPEGKMAREFLGRLGKESRSSWSKRASFLATKAINEGGPLLAFKDLGNGRWDIGVFRNDDFPRWHELFDNGVSDIDMIAKSHVESELDVLATEFGKYIAGESEAPTESFRKYVNSLSEQELDALIADDPNALWAAYARHLEVEMGHYRLSNDPDAYKNLAEVHRAVDDMAKAGGEKSKSLAVSPEALIAAWDSFRKEYKAISEKLSDRSLALSNDPLNSGPVAWGYVPESPEFFKQLRSEVRQQIINEVAEVRHIMDRIRWSGDDRFGLRVEGKDSRPYEFFSRDSHKLDSRMEAEIDRMVDEQIIASGRWPQFEKFAEIHKAVKADEVPVFVPMSDNIDLIPDDTGDFRDQISYMSQGATPSSATAAASRKRISAEDAARLARSRLDTDHATYVSYITSAEQAVKRRVDETIARLGIEPFTLDPTTSTSGSTQAPPKAPSPVTDRLEQLKGTFFAEMRELGEHFAGNRTSNTAHYVQEVKDRYDYHLRQSGDRYEALKATTDDLRRQTMAKVLQELTNHEASSQLVALGRQSLDALYSRIDGRARKGVSSPGRSIAETMSSRVANDTTPFLTELLESGYEELFRNNDGAFMRALFAAMRGQADVDPVIVKLAETLKKTNEMQAGRMNSLGANIRLLDKFLFSQVHDSASIRNNTPEFISDLHEWLDWSAVERAVGPNTDSGFDRNLYLKQLAHEMSRDGYEAPPDFDPTTMGGNIANRVGLRRTLHFTGTHAFDYDMKYGSGNTSGLMVEQFIKRAELSTVMEHFGADYKKSWNSVMADLGHQRSFLIEKLGLQNVFQKMQRIDLTVQGLTGDLNHPESIRMADAGRAARNAMNSVALWMSGVSSITDIGNAASTMRWMGADPKKLNADLFAAMKQRALDPKGREFMLAQGAGLQALLTSYSRVTNSRGPLYSWAQRASDFTFKWSGQQIWTSTLQGAFHDITTKHLGAMAESGTLSPEFRNWLTHYDITPDEWKVMARGAAEIDGLEGIRLAPDMVEDRNLAAKLRMAISDSSHQAIIEPSVSDRSLLSLGMKSGTVSGEAVRMVMQYKSYPMALLRGTHRRFANAYGNETMTAFGVPFNKGRIEQLVWAGSMISLATTALAIKDVLRGREPLNPLDTDQWNLRNMSRVVTQAGVGPFAVIEQFASGHQLMGPAFGTAYDIGASAVSGNGYRMTNAVMGSVPVLSAAPIKEASKAILGAIFTDSYGQNYQTFLRRLEDETGQTSIFLDKP